MIDPQATKSSYGKLMVLVVLLGLASAVVTFLFIALTNWGTELVWQQAAPALGIDPRLLALLFCTAGGLLVGLLVKLFGDHNGIFADLMREFGETGRFNYRHAPGILVTSFVSLVAGGSLGPEAPLLDACGGMGTLLSDRLELDDRETRTLGFSGVSGMLAAFITEPIGGALLGLESAQDGGGGKQTYFWVLFPSLVASAVATVVFVLLSGGFFQTLYRFPQYHPRVVDLFYAVPLGLVGGLAGLLFMFSLRRLQRLFLVMKTRVVLRGLIGGFGMGLIGALLPLTLFSGESQAAGLIVGGAQIGAGMLAVMALAKLFSTSLLLATGWKGGYIFPILFASVALGVAATLVFPAIPLAAAVAATMGGALVAALRAPLFAILFALVLVQKETAAVVAVAVVAAALLSTLLARRAAQPPVAAPQAGRPGPSA